MTPLTLTQSQARRFLLAYQNLWPPRSLTGKAAVLAFIRKVGCIQFDPLDIAGKNPELVLQSRVADFTPPILDELLYQDRALLDGFDKMMAIYPVEDWPYFRRRREAAKNELRSQDAVRAITPGIRAAIEQRGPLSSIDLEHKQKVDWWWAPTSLSRAALESMYLSGELVIHHKVHTRKVYDLAEHHIPAELLHAPEPNPTNDQYHEWYVLRRLGSVGLLWNRSNQVWLMSIGTAARKKVMQRLLDEGKILEVRVEGIEHPFYLRSQDQPLLEEILRAPEPTPRAAFIAPLDNLVWERSLLETLFGFDYRWEVYVPPTKRKYGYYVLPVLYGDRFVARIEPARQKNSGFLTVKNWWWEPDVVPDDAMRTAIRECFERFCAFLSIQDGRGIESIEQTLKTRAPSG
jgi:uncharacterized protein YcaQ